MIRLWGFRYSTNADRVSIACAYKGVEYEPVVIDPADRTRVVALTGQELVPVLEEPDGRLTWDSPRVLARLEELHPEPSLLPAERTARAQAHVFCEWFNRVWKVAPNAMAEEGGEAADVAAEPGPSPISGEDHSVAMACHQDVIEDLLGDGREHLLGDFGIADVTAWPFLRYAVDDVADDTDPFHQVLRDQLDVSSRPATAAWIERVAARSDAQARFGLA